MLNIQRKLFPSIEEVLGPLTEKHRQLIKTLEILQVESFVKLTRGYRGRPLEDRQALARSFVAKAVYNISQTKGLMDRLKTDTSLRQLCGFDSIRNIPSKATFSRAFDEFSKTRLPQVVLDALIIKSLGHRLLGHISRDSTAIEAREKPQAKPGYQEKRAKSKHHKGRPKKDEIREKETTRIEKQLDMGLDEMLAYLPRCCDVGVKKDSKGYKKTWTGYKLHIDAADGDIPISCVLTSASVHDSQVAIPLATMTHQKVINLYDLMDAAYDSPEIKAHSLRLNHIPIIDVNPRRNQELKEHMLAEGKKEKVLNFKTPQKVRYNQRSSVERVNSRLKDEFGGRNIRVKGNLKIMAHLMFGILALTADQLMKYVI